MNINFIQLNLQKIALISGMIIILFANHYFVDRYYKHRKYEYVDINLIQDAIVKSITSQTSQNINVEEVILKYREAFANEIQEYSMKNNVILFSTPKPLIGAKDVTNYFIINLNKITP